MSKKNYEPEGEHKGRAVSRCNRCFDGPERLYGTPLSLETISLYQQNDPNEPIATIVRCPKCLTVHQIKPLPGLRGLGLKIDNVRHLAENSACCSFDICELKTGKLGTVLVPEHVKFNQEPTQAALPF